MVPSFGKDRYVVVNKAAYRVLLPFSSLNIAEVATPKRGDVVVFASKRQDGALFMKRIIGLPGETLAIRDRQIFINDKPMPRNLHSASDQILSKLQPSPEDRFPEDYKLYVEGLDQNYHVVSNSKSDPVDVNPVTIPDKMYFVLGDNRDNSYDSSRFGPIAADAIVGKVIW